MMQMEMQMGRKERQTTQTIWPPNWSRVINQTNGKWRPIKARIDCPPLAGATFYLSRSVQLFAPPGAG